MNNDGHFPHVLFGHWTSNFYDYFLFFLLVQTKGSIYSESREIKDNRSVQSLKCLKVFFLSSIF